jgi:hypothetical protein
MSNSIRVKIILAENLLRRPFTADGPISLEGMFEVGYPNRASMSRHARRHRQGQRGTCQRHAGQKTRRAARASSRATASEKRLNFWRRSPHTSFAAVHFFCGWRGLPCGVSQTRPPTEAAFYRLKRAKYLVCNIYDATLKIIAVAKVKANIVIHICSSIAWQAGARPVSLSHRRLGYPRLVGRAAADDSNSMRLPMPEFFSAMSLMCAPCADWAQTGGRRRSWLKMATQGGRWPTERGWPCWPSSKMFNNNNMFKTLTLGRWPTLSFRG